MTQPLSIALAAERLLAPAQIDRDDLSRTLGALAGRGTDLADLFLEHIRSRSWRLENGRVTAGTFRIDQGIGARAAIGGAVSFAHSADLRRPALADLAGAVVSLQGGRTDHGTPVALAAEAPPHAVYAPIDRFGDGNAAHWIAILERIDILARSADPRIVRVDAFIRATDQAVLIADLDGRIAADIRPTVQVMIDVVAERAGRRANGHAGLGGRHGLAMIEGERLDRAIARAVRVAVTNLDARPSPAGTMPVVLAPGFPGVLFHEAVGHGLEGDFHRKRLSAFDGRMGERIGAPGVTVVDDGGLPGLLGSLGIDDEGTPTARTTLVEDGILTGLMQDRLNAGLMNTRPTGNGRRQS